MDLYAAMEARYSVRAYRTEAIPDEVLERVLDAARGAPSACNLQPWRFYVVRDVATREALHPRMTWARTAPITVAACGIPVKAWKRGADGKNHVDVDVAIATEHLVLAAAAEGLGTCWICAFDPSGVRAALNLPDEETPVALIPIGYPASVAPERKRAAREEVISER